MIYKKTSIKITDIHIIVKLTILTISFNTTGKKHYKNIWHICSFSMRSKILNIMLKWESA